MWHGPLISLLPCKECFNCCVNCAIVSVGGATLSHSSFSTLLHTREAVGKCGSGETFFNAMPSIASENSLLQHRMKLYSPIILVPTVKIDPPRQLCLIVKKEQKSTFYKRRSVPLRGRGGGANCPRDSRSKGHHNTQCLMVWGPNNVNQQ